MRKVACIPLVVLLLTGLLASCSGEGKAEKHAIAACDLKKESDGYWLLVTPFANDKLLDDRLREKTVNTWGKSENTWGVGGELWVKGGNDLHLLEEIGEIIKTRTAEAVAAAKLDSGFNKLSEAFASITTYGAGGGITEIRAECSVLATRLNK